MLFHPDRTVNLMINVLNPADGSLVGTAPDLSTAEVKAAIDRTSVSYTHLTLPTTPYV